MWMKQYPSKDFRHYHFDYCSQVYKKKYLKVKKKCEDDNMKCNIENVPKEVIIHSDQINIWNVNSKYHATTDHTKHRIRIHTMKNPNHSSLYAKKSIFRSHMKSHARENLNPYALYER